MKLFQKLIVFLILYPFVACKDAYLPDVRANESAVLIVEGMLNTGDSATLISVTRAVKLMDTPVRKPETGAQLSVEGSQGDRYMLAETEPGRYSTATLPLNASQTYRLAIVTKDGLQYQSADLTVLQNPPVDSLNWRRDTTGVHLYVNTHRNDTSIGYYRWEYQETWAIRSFYPFVTIPGIVEDDGILEPLYPGESLYYCWKYYKSSNLILASTTRLAANIISEKQLVFIPRGSDKLSERYRLRVRQYVLDKAGYEFYQLMQKNTESLGSIFDAQPTEITGNVHAVSNNALPVIGYVTATTTTASEIIINDTEVPYWPADIECSQTRIVNSRLVDLRTLFPGDWLPISLDLSGNVGVARRECVSCRLRGGSTHRPIDW